MIKIVNSTNSFRECNACRSELDVKELHIGKTENNVLAITLCKACRNVLHKRLHEEGQK